MDVKPLNEIKNRRDFEEAFQSAMSGAYQSLRAFWHFEKKQNLPKSYFIEFHPKSNHCVDHTWSTETVFSALQESGQSFGTNVQRTEDDSLLFLSHYEPGNEAEFIVDCLNPRFLVFHTISNASSTDRFIVRRLTQYHPEFDRFWFPVDLLEKIKDREFVTGWEAKFDPKLGADDFAEIESDVEETTESDEDVEIGASDELPARILNQDSLAISLVQKNALDKYQWLKSEPGLFPDVPLSSVLAERYDEQLSTYAQARIKSDGKVTGRGSDFSAYLQIVNGTLDNYAELVSGLESEYWIRPKRPDQEGATGFGILGKPFCIKFHKEINIEKLIRLMFYCGDPFRLMGEPEQLAENYFAVDALDLHVNQSLAFEIAPRLMRIYLYEGTCGNTLVRIIRSLQHHVDSNLEHPPLAANACKTE